MELEKQVFCLAFQVSDIINPESPSFNYKTLYTVIHSYAASFGDLRCNNAFEEFLNMHQIIASQYKGII